jgi:hypothetical protein
MTKIKTDKKWSTKHNTNLTKNRGEFRKGKQFLCP